MTTILSHYGDIFDALRLRLRNCLLPLMFGLSGVIISFAAYRLHGNRRRRKLDAEDAEEVVHWQEKAKHWKAEAERLEKETAHWKAEIMWLQQKNEERQLETCSNQDEVKRQCQDGSIQKQQRCQENEAGLHEAPNPQQWSMGDPVERLLDDISDIWVGAVVLIACGEEHYDISYVDNGSIERDVEGCELRPRKARLDMPAEVWESVGSCLFACRDLCTFEQIAAASRSAMQQNFDPWWCTAFHQQFGRCSGRCQFERASGSGDASSAVAAIKFCQTSSAVGRSGENMSWKARYVEHERLTDPTRRFAESEDKAMPGDAAYYGINGKKISYIDPLAGWYFDARLGHMVREC